MKTWDGVSKPEAPPAPAPRPGCCGPEQDRMLLIKRVHASLAYGHMNVAVLYRTLAVDPGVSESDKLELEAMAAKHDVMAKESETVLVPDHLKDPE